MKILEPNMYVRTNDGYIAKIRKIESNEILHLHLKAIYTDNYQIDMVLEDTIIKASHNIIDLIEVGDYVNGYYVEDVKETFINIATGSNYFQSPSISEEDVKTIVTKQQMESMQYEVKQ